jgi:phosphate transport system permease protein
MFNWISRPQHAFHINAAATGAVIIMLTLVMNGFAIKLRYNIRKKIKW